MNATLAKSLVALAPAGVLVVGSTILFCRSKAVLSFLQLFGAGCFVMVALAHLCEALHLLPWMRWGLENSVGHYLDLSGAILGLTLFPAGYLSHVLATRPR